jgi:hypothetical protein
VIFVERMSLAELQRYVGAPTITDGTSYFAGRRGYSLTAWEDELDGVRGWWCAVTQGRLVLSVVWAPGGAFERDRRLATSLERVRSFLTGAASVPS